MVQFTKFILIFILCFTVFSQNVKNLNKKLLEAVRANKLKDLKFLVNNGASVNNRKNNSLLITAVEKGHVEITEYLLKNGADVNALNIRKSNALMIAAYYGHSKIAQMLIDNKIDIAYEAPNGYKSFDYALEGKKFGLMKLIARSWLKHLNDKGSFFLEKLLDTPKNYSFNKTDLKNLSENTKSLSLVFAVLDNNLDLLKLLINNGFSPNVHNMTGYTVLPLACRLGKMDFVRYLVEKGHANIHIGNDGNDEASPLHQAARGGQLDIGTYLIKNGVNINKANARNYTAFIASVVYNNTEFAITLLNSGARPELITLDHNNALDFAFFNKNKKIIAEIFFYYLKKVQINDSNLKIFESYKNSSSGLKIGKHIKASIALTNLAVLKNDKNTVIKIIKTGFDINQRGPSGYYPLSVAAAFSDSEMVEILLKAGAYSNSINTNRYQTTALIESSRNGNIEIADLLLKNKAVINYTDVNNDHVLNWAAFFGHTEYLSYLLDHGADPNVIGRDSGDNALDIAIRRGFPEIVDELKRRSAKSAK